MVLYKIPCKKALIQGITLGGGQVWETALSVDLHMQSCSRYGEVTGLRKLNGYSNTHDTPR